MSLKYHWLTNDKSSFRKVIRVEQLFQQHFSAQSQLRDEKLGVLKTQSDETIQKEEEQPYMKGIVINILRTLEKWELIPKKVGCELRLSA